MQEALAKKVKGIWAFASGFAETDADGGKAQETIRKFCHDNNLMFCGPNCVGYANFTDQVSMYSAPLPQNIRSGGIGVIAQSGAVLMALINSNRKTGFSKLISSGNEASLYLGDYINYLVDDEATSVIALFIETIRDAEVVEQACLRASKKGKPIIALKVGRSEKAAQVATTHTGAMTGSDDVVDSFLRRCNVVRVQSLDELLESAILFDGLKDFVKPKLNEKDNNIGLITVSGGEMGMLADICSDYELNFPELSEEGYRELRNILPSYTPVANPLDAWGSGDLKNAYPASVATLAKEADIDLVVVSQDIPGNMSQAQIEQFLDVAHACVQAQKLSKKPIVMLSNISGGLDESISAVLSEGEIPLLQGSVEAFCAVTNWFKWHKTQKCITSCAEAKEKALDIPKELLARIENCHGIADYRLSVDILEFFGIPVQQEALTSSFEEAQKFAAAFYPVVVKGISAKIPHKTESGLVQLNIQNEQELKEAWDAIDASMKLNHPEIQLEGILVQSMVQRDKVEMLVGVNRDPLLGSAVLLAFGGIFAELLEDSVVELAPINSDIAHNMLDRLKCKKILTGFRGKPVADIDALIDIVEKIGQLAYVLGDKLISLDLNPVMVLSKGDGVRIVDMVIELA